MLATGSLLAAALLPLRLLVLIALTATDAAGTLEKNLLELLLCPQRHGPAGRGNTMALKDERSPKYAFPEAGTSLLKSPKKSLSPTPRILEKGCYTFLDAGYWLAASCCTAAVALTATDCSYCYLCCWNPRKKIYWSCCCAHKDTALPDGETPWP